MPKQSMQPTDTGAHQDQFEHQGWTSGQPRHWPGCVHIVLPTHGLAATSSQPSAAQPTAWCGRGGRPSLQWGRAALPGVTSLSPSRRARRPPGPRPRTRSSLASRSTSDQWSASASPLRKPLLRVGAAVDGVTAASSSPRSGFPKTPAEASTARADGLWPRLPGRSPCGRSMPSERRLDPRRCGREGNVCNVVSWE